MRHMSLLELFLGSMFKSGGLFLYLFFHLWIIVWLKFFKNIWSQMFLGSNLDSNTNYDLRTNHYIISYKIIAEVILL